MQIGSVHTVGDIEQLDQIASIHRIDEIIFCAKDTTAREIIKWMTTIQKQQIDYKIAQPDSLYLIGSNSIETAGDLYILDINAIAQTSKQRQKRILDALVGFSSIVLSPILCWFFQHKLQWLKNSFHLLIGKITLVGYSNTSKNDLPRIKKGILTPHEHIEVQDEQLITKLDLLYAREYHILTDIRIVLRSWKKLDRTI